MLENLAEVMDWPHSGGRPGYEAVTTELVPMDLLGIAMYASNICTMLITTLTKKIRKLKQLVVEMCESTTKED